MQIEMRELSDLMVCGKAKRQYASMDISRRGIT